MNFGAAAFITSGVIVVLYLVWVEVSEWRDLRARQRSSAEAWGSWCDMARESFADIEAGREPRPLPKWRDPHTYNNC